VLSRGAAEQIAREEMHAPASQPACLSERPRVGPGVQTNAVELMVMMEVVLSEAI